MSLQHVPYDKDLEKSLPKEVMPRLSFAKQKVEEMVALAKSAKADKSKKLQLPTVGMYLPPGLELQIPCFEAVQQIAAACLWHLCPSHSSCIEVDVLAGGKIAA